MCNIFWVALGWSAGLGAGTIRQLTSPTYLGTDDMRSYDMHDTIQYNPTQPSRGGRQKASSVISRAASAANIRRKKKKIGGWWVVLLVEAEVDVQQ